MSDDIHTRLRRILAAQVMTLDVLLDVKEHLTRRHERGSENNPINGQRSLSRRNSDTS